MSQKSEGNVRPLTRQEAKLILKKEKKPISGRLIQLQLTDSS